MKTVKLVKNYGMLMLGIRSYSAMKQGVELHSNNWTFVRRLRGKQNDSYDMTKSLMSLALSRSVKSDDSRRLNKIYSNAKYIQLLKDYLITNSDKGEILWYDRNPCHKSCYNKVSPHWKIGQLRLEYQENMDTKERVCQKIPYNLEKLWELCQIMAFHTYKESVFNHFQVQ